MRYYIVVFDRVSSKSYMKFHEDFVGHQGVTYWWHYVKSCYLIGTELFTADSLANHYAAVAAKHDLPNRHLVLRVNLATRNGYLTDEAWKWIDIHKLKDK